MKRATIVNSRLNPRVQRRLFALLRRETSSGVSIVARTEYAGHATRLARLFSMDGYDTLIVCGGDGTINEVVNGMNLKSCALGIIPMGTANDLAHHYTIPNEPEEALKVISAGRLHRRDLISVNGWKCATVSGIGLGAEALRIVTMLRSNDWLARALTRMFRCRLYSLGLCLALLNRSRYSFAANLQCDQGTTTGNYASLIIGNQAVLGNQFKVLPTAVDDDGCLEAFAIGGRISLMDLLAVVYRVLKGIHLGTRHVSHLKCRKLRVELDRTLPFFRDGEIGGLVDKLEVTIAPKALKVLVPADWEYRNRR